MNIVIIGPGKDPERYGNYFCKRAKEDGHTVHKYSYRIVPGLSEPEDITKDYSEYLLGKGKIDLLLYNCIGGFYPGHADEYTTSEKVKFEEWQMGIMINAAMPHMFSIETLKHMDENSGIVFMTSSASYLINRDNYLELAGYFGTKGVMNQLARSLAEFNDKNAIVSIFAPHIPYENKEEAKKVMDSLYNKAVNLERYDSGKIIEFYPPEGNPAYFLNDGKYQLPKKNQEN